MNLILLYYLCNAHKEHRIYEICDYIKSEAYEAKSSCDIRLDGIDRNFSDYYVSKLKELGYKCFLDYQEDFNNLHIDWNNSEKLESKSYLGVPVRDRTHSICDSRLMYCPRCGYKILANCISIDHDLNSVYSQTVINWTFTCPKCHNSFEINEVRNEHHKHVCNQE